MDRTELRTSLAQRIFIILIAVFMLGSAIAVSALMILKGSKESETAISSVDESKIMELEEAYVEVEADFMEATKSDFEQFIRYKSEIKGFNEVAANASGVATRDLEIGVGEELAAGDSDYYAYYVGWCADESIFDSSFDNNKNPKAFSRILDASLGMIEGWNIGVEGMRPEGIREITIPSVLAYGESLKICGGYNKPLKFIIMVKEKTDALVKLATELENAYMRLNYARDYGIYYDDLNTE